MPATPGGHHATVSVQSACGDVNNLKPNCFTNIRQAVLGASVQASHGGGADNYKSGFAGFQPIYSFRF
jgi:hypothetical protein